MTAPSLKRGNLWLPEEQWEVLRRQAEEAGESPSQLVEEALKRVAPLTPKL